MSRRSSSSERTQFVLPRRTRNYISHYQTRYVSQKVPSLMGLPIVLPSLSVARSSLYAFTISSVNKSIPRYFFTTCFLKMVAKYSLLFRKLLQSNQVHQHNQPISLRHQYLTSQNDGTYCYHRTGCHAVQACHVNVFHNIKVIKNLANNKAPGNSWTATPSSAMAMSLALLTELIS